MKKVKRSFPKLSIPKLTLDPWQIEFLKTNGDKILCCGRQIGKTEICAQDAGEYAIANPKTKPIVMVAPTERQAYALFSKTLNWFANNYPNLICTGTDRPTKERIKLTTGVEIYCLPVGSNGLSIRFITIGRLYMDEGSRLNELVFEAIEPALLTTGGDTIILSTPFGCQGEFYNIFTNKDGAYDSFTRFSKDSETVIRERKICETWTEIQREKALLRIERAKKRWSNNRFAQEYLGKFIEDLHKWFSDKLIEDIATLQPRESVNPRGEHYLGIDLARMGEDEIVYAICDRTPTMIEQVGLIVEKKKLLNETMDKILQLDARYHFQKIFIDAGSGSMGVGLLDFCLAHPQLKRKVVAINNAKRVIEYDPEGKPRETKLMKEDLYENLKALMEQRRIKLLDNEDLIASLASVQYEYAKKVGQLTQLRIFGDYTHIAEALIRMAWCIKEKHLNFRFQWV